MTAPGPTTTALARRAGMAIVALLAAVAALAFVDPGTLYPWVKALHVMAVISWMAGLFYLPRLFIYHTGSEPGSQQSETFKLMEARLYRIIMVPAMVLSWVFGLWIAIVVHGMEPGWLHAKLLAVVILSGVNGYFGRAVRAFAADERRHDTRFWRLMNEVPTLLMIVIVILVIVQPF